jgi:Zn finger protein HypA/HybF involved in hydrogenase expression
MLKTLFKAILYSGNRGLVVIRWGGGWCTEMRRLLLCRVKRYQGTDTARGNPTVYLKPSQGSAANWCKPLMISAQCPECQSEEIQLSTGKRRE